MKRGENIYVGPLRVYIADVKNDQCEIFVSYDRVSFGSATVNASSLEALQEEASAFQTVVPGTPGNEIND